MCAVSQRGTAASSAPVRLELADIVRAHGPTYRATHRLARVQAAAFRAIETCRTAVLGGHREACARCGATRIRYNSCRNRHCPKCQGLAQARWLAARRAELLPIPYFHVVFTLPHALNALAPGNPRVIYTLLFRAAADTLLTFGRDSRHLGGTIGVTAILHTWGQNLSQHLQVHCLVTGGALAPDRGHWIPARPTFLFVRALSVVFRAKYLAGLERAIDSGQLTFAAGTADLADPATFTRLLHRLRRTDWVVYAKRPFAGSAQVLAYLGRYTHRVALTNRRLVSLNAAVVRFHWTDYADGGRGKIMALAAEEFLRRFLLHILPARFVRIRHFGLLANRRRRANVSCCRTLLAPAMPPTTDEDTSTAAHDDDRCPICGHASWHVVEVLPPRWPTTPPPALDSS